MQNWLFIHYFFIVHSNMLILLYVLQILLCYIKNLILSIAKVKDNFVSLFVKKWQVVPCDALFILTHLHNFMQIDKL